nr:hypothetical protein Iba_chr01fCG9810 [Ipomoea batatas]GMD57445.1 hypothetical protein Iba_chr11eCG12800 [Ipomoea batatas]GMD58453.1 hypothetical protein Iba_scaffold1433555CG0010 [Ipomoea batatas]GMD78940.1 hypothetical protein Iba_chr13cCG17810 [Ipomoea batatas]GMD87730.1 hypothetical protein Iba_chr14cCG0170 [Ipomoea batatas]
MASDLLAGGSEKWSTAAKEEAGDGVAELVAELLDGEGGTGGRTGRRRWHR